MRVKFYGVRGSIPVCGKEFQRYGGNTTCLRIERETAHRTVIFDAGTGIRKLGKELIAHGLNQPVLNIVFSHFHWDHLQGFPFFAPAYKKDQQIGILVMGKEKRFTNLREVFTRPLQHEYFPVALEKMGAQFNFLNLGEAAIYYGTQVYGVAQHHIVPGGSYGFRMEDDSVSLAICTDLEHINGIDPKVVSFAKDADLLIHDGQYTEEEYKKYKGWGHSTWKQAIEVAKLANVKRLVITHHDPDHDDDFLDAMERECKELFPDCLLAREGMELQV